MWKSVALDNAWVKDSRPFIPFFFTLVFRAFSDAQTRLFGLEIPNYGSGLFKNASFGPSPNLHKRISLVEVYRFGQFLSWRFSPISTFFSLESSRASGDAPHSRFRCGDPNQCLPNFLKILLLALPQIYTRVFLLWKSIDLDSAQSRRDQATRSVILTSFGSISSILGDI